MRVYLAFHLDEATLVEGERMQKGPRIGACDRLLKGLLDKGYEVNIDAYPTTYLNTVLNKILISTEITKKGQTILSKVAEMIHDFYDLAMQLDLPFSDKDAYVGIDINTLEERLKLLEGK